MNEFIRKLNGARWAPISRRAMDDGRLSISARGVFAWLCSRPDDHRVILSYALTRWGITQPTWSRIRNELVAAGYLKVQKVRKKGRFVWTFELTDSPPPTVPVADQLPVNHQTAEGPTPTAKSFDEALQEVDDEFKEWKDAAGAKRKGSITAWHLKNKCIPQLRRLFESGGVDAVRDALETGIMHGLRDFSAVLDGSIN